jgi:hypothetical protein
MTLTPFAMPGAKRPAPPPPDLEAITIDQPLEPIRGAPTPLPGPPVSRHLPLYGIQYLRREALRLAVQRYHDIDATDKEILETAHLFAEYIRNGKHPERKS